MIRQVTLAAVILPLSAAAQTCNPSFDGGERIESERFSLGYRTRPARVEVGKHFAVEFVVCPKNGGPPPESVRIDAHMPEHRHGMNYVPQLQAGTAGPYVAQGLMFHMPGRWEFLFDVRSGGRTDRLASSVRIE